MHNKHSEKIYCVSWEFYYVLFVMLQITNVVYSPVRPLHISISAGLAGHDGGFATKEIC